MNDDTRRIRDALARIEAMGGFPKGWPSIPLTAPLLENIATIMEYNKAKADHEEGFVEPVHLLLATKYHMTACPFCKANIALRVEVELLP